MRRALDTAGYDDIPGNGLYLIGGLSLNAHEIPLGQLIRELRISKQAAGQLVDQLVLRGYLQRSIDGDDRRKLTVSLTERGRAAAEVQQGAREVMDAALVEVVGPEDVARMRRGLAALIDLNRSDDGVPDGDA
ncbi:hypothetical protein BH10PSE2_BH10PSE2_19480 [soil metagenome]